MWDILNIVAGNVGFSFPNLIWTLNLIGGIIFYASGFKHGMVVSLITNAGLFIWFYEAGYYYVLPLISLFLILILMSFSFIAIDKANKGVGYL